MCQMALDVLLGILISYNTHFFLAGLSNAVTHIGTRLQADFPVVNDE